MMCSRFFLVALLVTCLAGCGTSVPELREWPNNQNEAQNLAMVEAIVRSVRCELSNAVSDVINTDKSISGSRSTKRAYADFLYGWGAEVLLTLTIKESSAGNVSAVGMPPSPASAVFTVAGGLGLSATATRIEKLNFFYPITAIYHPEGETCDASGEERNDSLLVRNDLKIGEILDAKITAAALGNAYTPAPGLGQKRLANSENAYTGEKNVISHEVSFEVVSTGNVTPAWKLVRATINPVSPFLSASRDRTHDLIITFGPLDKKNGGTSLIPIAEQAHFSSQIANGIVSGFNSSVGR